MDVERTIKFLLENQARADARFAAQFDRADERFLKAEARLDRLERVVALNNRITTRLVRYGVSLRSDVRRLTQATRADFQRLAQAQAATDRALKTLIETVTHRNGRS